MKSTIVLVFFIVFSSALLIVTHFQRKEKQSVFSSATFASTFYNADNAVQSLASSYQSNPDDIRLKKQLAFAYIQQSRQRTNPANYDASALQLFNEILEKDPNDFESLIGKSTVLLSQHHFSEALESGLRAQKQNPYSSACYGVLTDAYLETGDYPKAIANADKMNAIRPDLRSYSRISYLREINGDYKGAMYAMEMAVQSGIPGFEETEWCRYQLAALNERYGNLQKADTLYRWCIAYRPNFSVAYAGRARVFQKEKNYAEAERYFQLALTLSHSFYNYEQLAKLYRETNQQEKAAITIRKAIAQLADNGNNGNLHGHYSDRELALLYLESYDYSSALKHAKLEYDRRPENIDVNHTLAWTYYKLGKYDLATIHIAKAMKTNSKDPELLYHAGLIHNKYNAAEIGMKEMKEAIAINPHLDQLTLLENKY